MPPKKGYKRAKPSEVTDDDDEILTADDHALHFLATEGFLPLSMADHPALLSAYSSLFAHAASFFALPADSIAKADFAAASGAAASEEGFSQILSEKSIATVKIESHCPTSLQDPVRAAWAASGRLLRAILKDIATTLHLDVDVFAPFVEPCVYLPDSERTPTLLRMFRYDRPPGTEPKVNAERHKDLGLLSLVIGHSPGLHVLSPTSDHWIPIEEKAFLPPGTKERSLGLTATLLCGQTLAYLTRGKYRAGVHGVVCDPAPTASNQATASQMEDRLADPALEPDDNCFRYSIVFTLRPAAAPVFTKHFESDIVGKFPLLQVSDGTSSAELFGKIKSSHYNVNVAPAIREQQKAKARQQASGSMGVKDIGEFLKEVKEETSNVMVVQPQRAQNPDSTWNTSRGGHLHIYPGYSSETKQELLRLGLTYPGLTLRRRDDGNWYDDVGGEYWMAPLRGD